MNDIREAILLSQLKKVDPRTDPSTKPLKPSSGESNGPSFDTVLENTNVQFSKHAERRLQARNIEFSQTDRTKLDNAVGTLQKKGAKDSLVLMGELALIVNIPSKTVVTAMTKDQMKEHVFTNIDSTMLVDK